mgnify:FL=1
MGTLRNTCPSFRGEADRRNYDMKKPIIAILLGLGTFGLSACDTNDGPAEELGEELDDAADDVEDELD